LDALDYNAIFFRDELGNIKHTDRSDFQEIANANKVDENTKNLVDSKWSSYGL